MVNGLTGYVARSVARVLVQISYIEDLLSEAVHSEKGQSLAGFQEKCPVPLCLPTLIDPSLYRSAL